MTIILMLIHLLKRAWNNGRVKWNIFRKSSLNFTFGQDGSRKSAFARSNSSKLVLLEISQDWRRPYLITFCVTFQQLWLLNFKDGPRNFATSKISVLRQEWTFCSFLFTTLAKRPFLNVLGFLDPFLDCDEFVF